MTDQEEKSTVTPRMQHGAHQRVAVIVAGPTCSGKSALALELAERVNGTIVNTDSMQVYRELHVLTARPSAEDEARVPHRLYGVLPAAEVGSVGWWRQAALAEMETAWAAGRVPILCGGTGMYMRALTEGLAETPDPGPEARDEARNFAAVHGAPALHARLMEADPETGAQLRPADTQRVCRAWEVWRGTGRGLAWWRAQPGLPPAPCRFRALRLAPPRPELRAAIAARFDAMLAAGALDEVRALVARDLDPALPAMRAHGVPELAAALRGEMTMAAARERAVIATGQYTRRQATWFAHHTLTEPGWTDVFEMRMAGMTQYMERKLDEIIPLVQNRIDGP